MVTAPVERRRVHHHFQGFQECVKQKMLKKTVKKQMHIPALKKIGVFYWRRAQFLKDQSFRCGETHILSKNDTRKLYRNEKICKKSCFSIDIHGVVQNLYCNHKLTSSIQTILCFAEWRTCCSNAFLWRSVCCHFQYPTVLFCFLHRSPSSDKR